MLIVNRRCPSMKLTFFGCKNHKGVWLFVEVKKKSVQVYHIMPQHVTPSTHLFLCSSSLCYSHIKVQLVYGVRLLGVMVELLWMKLRGKNSIKCGENVKVVLSSSCHLLLSSPLLRHSMRGCLPLPHSSYMHSTQVTPLPHITFRFTAVVWGWW